MLYRYFGDNNNPISVIGLGCEGLVGKSESEVKEMFDAAFDNGINYLDLFMPEADIRSNVGKAIAGRRDKIIIQGHLCTVLEDGQYCKSYDLERTKASFEDLLERLGTDYIDVGMIHFVDSEEDYKQIISNGIVDYAKELKEKGIIKHIGISSHNASVALKVVESGLIDVLMFSINPAFDFEDSSNDIYSMVEFKGLDDGTLTPNFSRSRLYAECETRGIGITVMKAFAGGSLLSEKTSPFGKALTPVQCIEYALSRPGVINVISGCHNVDEISEDVSYCIADDKKRDFSHIFADNPRLAKTKRCMYCNHCRPCTSNIDIAKVTKYLDLALMDEEVPESVMQHYRELEFNAMDCLMCGCCERRCPFGVPVIDNMMRAQRVFHPDCF